jgi:tetratricopeptide (TPR) repeat protein
VNKEKANQELYKQRLVQQKIVIEKLVLLMAKAIKTAGKINGHRSTDWYSEEQIDNLLKHYLDTDYIQIWYALSNQEQLSYQLSRLPRLLDKPQHIIPLNVDALTGELCHGNHWVGLHILVNNDNNSVMANYINPMGYPANLGVCGIINQVLSRLFATVTIGQPLLKQGVQIAKQVSAIELSGNTDDCGPMLVYIMACQTRATDIIKIISYEGSISFGAFLRDSFARYEDFNTIYVTLSKNIGNHANFVAKKITSNNAGENSKAKLKLDKKLVENKLLINKEQLEETKKSITNLEKKLFPKWSLNQTRELLDSPREKAASLAQIKTSYEKALSYFKAGNLEKAEQELVKVLRPTLSKSSMKNLYVDTKDVLKETLDVLYHLGLVYLQDKRYTEHHAKSAAIFQYCAAFAKKYGINSEQYIAQAYNVEKEFLKSVGIYTTSCNNIKEQTDHYKSELEAIRTQTRQKLDEIDHLTVEAIAKRAKIVEEIYQDCSNFFTNAKGQGLIQKLLADCYLQLGGLPQGCEYAIIGLGSISGGKMTPYSDLDFAILVSDDKYKEYFRTLSKLLHIKVINLGETMLRSVGIESLNNFKTANESDDWFWDDIINSGFSFDGPHWYACKLPLGRQGYKAKIKKKNANDIEQTVIIEKEDYELILTPAQMAQFQKKEAIIKNAKNWFESDVCLVHSTRSVMLIDGSQELLDTYRNIIKAIVDLSVVQERMLSILQGDIVKFRLKLGVEEEGKLLDVKQDIYRLGDKVIDVLADYCGIIPDKGQRVLTVWQKIDKMQKEGWISESGAQHLKEAMSIAAELRLNTYCHNQSQSEGISTYVPAVRHLSETQKHKLLHKTFHIKDTSTLHHFYYVMLRLEKLILVFCDKEYHDQAISLLALDNLLDNTNYEKGIVHARFLEYDRALKYMEAAKQEKPEDLDILNDLFLLYNSTRTIEGAINVGNEILKIMESKCKDNPSRLGIANSYNNLGTAHSNKGEFDEAIKYFRKALEIRLVTYAGSPHRPDIADSYNNLGNAYRNKGEDDKAIKYYYKALEIQLEAYAQSPNHPDIASSYNNLGIAYAGKGEDDKAIEYFHKALDIQLKAYENSPNHPDIATSYNNLGAAYADKGEDDKAIEYYHKALEINLKSYENSPNHPNLAVSYDNLGTAYAGKGEDDKAIEYYHKALEISLKAYEQSPNHPDIATCYHNLGAAYADKGEDDRAIEYFHKTLNIRLEVYENNPNHPNIVASYNNLGVAYAGKGEDDKAIEYFHKALDIQFEIYGQSPNHLGIITSHINLGDIYAGKGEDDKAIEYYHKALDMQLEIYAQSPNHPDIASSYNNLGIAYTNKGEYSKAIKHFHKALDIQLEVYAQSPIHPDIAASYNNLGNVYRSQGEDDKAIEYHYKALDLQVEVYAQSPNHPDIAASYNNLGDIYAGKGEDDEAIGYYHKALDIQLEVYVQNPNHPDIAANYNNLGIAYTNKGEHSKAIKHFHKALDIQLKVYAQSPNHPDIAASYNNLGNAYRNQGEDDKAIEYHHKALDMQLEVYAQSPNHPDIAASYNNLGNAHRNKGEDDKAIGYYHKALAIQLEAYTQCPNHPDIAGSYSNLGIAYANKGEYGKAIEYSHKSLDIKLVVYARNLGHPDIVTSYNNLVIMYANNGEDDKATEYYHKALEISRLKAYEQNSNYPNLVSDCNYQSPQHLLTAETFNVGVPQLGNFAILMDDMSISQDE